MKYVFLVFANRCLLIVVSRGAIRKKRNREGTNARAGLRHVEAYPRVICVWWCLDRGAGGMVLGGRQLKVQARFGWRLERRRPTMKSARLPPCCSLCFVQNGRVDQHGGWTCLTERLTLTL